MKLKALDKLIASLVLVGFKILPPWEGKDNFHDRSRYYLPNAVEALEFENNYFSKTDNILIHEKYDLLLQINLTSNILKIIKLRESYYLKIISIIPLGKNSIKEITNAIIEIEDMKYE